MDIFVEPHEDYSVLYMTGELDSYTVPSLRAEVDGLLRERIHLAILDLHGIRFLNSSALGAIIESAKRFGASGGRMVIARPSSFCRDIFSRVGLNRVVAVFDTDDEAAAGLQS